MIFQDNTTFAIITSDSGWRYDLTLRYAEHFSRALNGEKHASRIITAETVDEALEQCATDYLIVQSPGSLVFNDNFFYAAEEALKDGTQIFLGELRIDYDYAHIDGSIIVVNIPLWKEHERIAFNSKIRSGPRFNVTKENLANKNSPLLIELDGEDTIFIPAECSISGGGIVAKQLQTFSKVTSLLDVVDSSSFFFLSRRSPYDEVHTETIFEKKYLAEYFKKVRTTHSDNIEDTKQINVEIVIAPALGLKPMMLARHFKAKKLIVYSKSAECLELQKIILDRKTSCLYKDVLDELKKKLPSVSFIDDATHHLNDAVVPLNIPIEYHVVDPLSFEMENFLKSIDDEPSALFDISNIYVNPYYFYKRPLYQVQGFYAQLNSLMGQRRGPTHILGVAPGNVLMNTLDINTSTLAYTWVPKPKPEEDPDAEVLEEGEEIEEEIEITPAMIQAQNAPWASNPEKPIEEKPIPTGFIQGIKAKIAEWIAEDKEEKKKPPAIIKKEEVAKIIAPAPKQEPVAAPAPILDLPPAPAPAPEPVFQQQLTENFIPKNAIEEALHQGFARTKRIENGVSYTVFTKNYDFTEFSATFEYSINQQNNSWTFKVCKKNGSRWVTFSTGQSDDAMLKHLQLPIKINPKTALKFL